MGKLWQKDYALDALIEKFTIGEDWKLDERLLISDCLSSIAHARMLKKIGLLQEDELAQLERELRQLVREIEAGNFGIRFEDEDGHTAIENYLVEKLGETGKKIHTGRSRNDQVIVALRLWSRGAALRLLEAGTAAARAFLELAVMHANTPMPGRTHMQVAMPSSVGLWAASFAEELYDDLLHLLQTALHVDQSPLGSAASYGVPLPLDREMVSEELGFAKLQNNVLYVNNSRGKFESLLLDAVDQVMLSLSKAAQDLIIFSMPEFGYFSLPKELCSGSSIMPQKKNPDMLELIRGKSATVSAWAQQVKQIIRALPSGYNRDMQETKEPFLRGITLTYSSLRVMQLILESLEVNTEVLTSSMPREIFATDEALRLVGEGMSFRDAYREVGTHPEKVPMLDPETVLAQRRSSGAPGRLGLEKIDKLLTGLESEIAGWKRSNDRRMAELAGGPVEPAEL